MTTLPATQVLRLERRGIALIATIDDPATRNAMSERLIADFEALLPAIADDRGIRALVLTGPAGLFCAGADLRNASGDARAANRRGGALFAAVDAQPQTVIAAIDGPAFGGGLGLACCADVVLAGPKARFALSETTLGLIPAQIAPYVVARLGAATTRRLALTAERLDADAAAAIGLADRSFADPAALAEALDATIAAVMRCAPQANAVTKALIRSLEPIDDAFRVRAADLFADCIEGPEGREGITAFTAKRMPEWAAS